MSSRLTKIRSVHTYVMLRTVYFGWICSYEWTNIFYCVIFLTKSVLAKYTKGVLFHSKSQKISKGGNTPKNGPANQHDTCSQKNLFPNVSRNLIIVFVSIRFVYKLSRFPRYKCMPSHVIPPEKNWKRTFISSFFLVVSLPDQIKKKTWQIIFLSFV